MARARVRDSALLRWSPVPSALACAMAVLSRNAVRRVDEVFDCWFESGAMPYAQVPAQRGHRATAPCPLAAPPLSAPPRTGRVQLHYPFENQAGFEEHRFPADFIAEGLDQTRGWFYTLM